MSDKAFALQTKQSDLETIFRLYFSDMAKKGHRLLAALHERAIYDFAELEKVNYFPKEKSEKIRPAIDFINRNFSRPKEELATGALADMCGISSSYLKQLFIRKFSLSPKQYILKRKMDYACELLLSGYYSVASVADSLSYENVYYFSRAFKKMTGTSPTEYQKKYTSSK